MDSHQSEAIGIVAFCGLLATLIAGWPAAAASAIAIIAIAWPRKKDTT